MKKKITRPVIPAKAGIQKSVKVLDSRLRGNDTLMFLFVSLILTFSTHLSAGDFRDRVKALESNVQKSVILPDVTKGKLKSGARYYFLPDHELPLVKVIIYLKGGNIYDPAGKSGLNAFSAALLRNGGTEKFSPDEMDNKLDFLSSQISISSSPEYISATLHSTSETFEESLNLLLDMLFQPRFDTTRYELLKRQFLNSVKRRADSPDALAGIGFDELLYDSTNPWGTYTTSKSVESISIDDIKALHSRAYHPEEMIIGITGDIDKGTVKRLFNDYKNYPAGKTEASAEPAANPAPKPGIYIIDKDRSQAVVNIGHEGSWRFNPDKYALVLMNDILGGGSFTRILPTVIRVKEGLAYTVGSSYGFGPEKAYGSFKIYMATKTESVSKAVETTRNELQKFVGGEGINEESLDKSKRSILSALIFEYASAIDVINNLVKFSYYGYPDDYIEKFEKSIAAVELDDVKRVARLYIHPDKLQVVIAGDGKEIEKQLNSDIKYEYITIEN